MWSVGLWSLLVGWCLTGAAVGAGIKMPSLDDERNTYRKWGWTWTASQEPSAVREPIANYTVRDPDIHGDTEGDDLWTYLMMYQRTGNTVYLNRATAWARYFKEDYRRCVGTPGYTYCADRDDWMLDHLYGWGLVDWANHSGDSAALTEATNLGAAVEQFWIQDMGGGQWPVPGQWRMSAYGARQGARHLLFAVRLAEAVPQARWIGLRDRLLDLWLQSPDWDARGMYFALDGIQSSFSVGILSDAFYRAYRATGRTLLRDRMVAMARFIDQYGLNPANDYAASWWGFVGPGGTMWYKGGTDPVYSTDLVNTLVLGYKFSGDTRLLDRAKYFFNRGTKGEYGTGKRLAGDTQVHHFMDTVFDSSQDNFYLAYNKGELQYTYLVFENGGNPTVEGSPPPDTIPPAPPMGLTVR
jgi:hypothetical protein